MKYGDLPVHDAARNNAHALRSLLTETPSLRDAKAFRAKTPLHAAVEADNLESLQILLEAGADVNALDDEGESPVFDAKSRKVMEALKEAGAKFDIYSRRGHYGFQHCAAYVGSLEALEFWWEQGFSVNHVPDCCYPALIGACMVRSRHKDYDCEKEKALVDFLLKIGADVNLRDDRGDTALIKTCWNQTLPMVRHLLDLGAEPNAANFSGTTALHHAVTRKNEELVRLLLSYGADPNQLDKYHLSPIDFARRSSCLLDILEPLAKPKPEKHLPTADEVIARLKNIPSFEGLELVGCSDEEIDKLEQHFKLKLPASYRYFLQRMGKDAGEFMVSDHLTFEYPQLFEIARQDYYEEYCHLSESAFVFAEREGCLFFFFEADGKSDEPPIFMFNDGGAPAEQVTRTFWEFLEEQVIYYEILGLEGRLGHRTYSRDSA